MDPFVTDTTIARPREEVYEYLADIANHAEFSDHFRKDWRLTREDTDGAVREMLDDPHKLREFEEEFEVDFSYSIPGVARFRVNAFKQRGSTSLVIRAIPVDIRSIDDLSLPPVIRDLAE